MNGRQFPMTNNIIEVSGAAIYAGLYELFIQFLLPVVVIWGGCYGVKVIIRAFKRVSGG